ncbi:hypothetical protein BG004_003372, partial [Podila humilis]
MTPGTPSSSTSFSSATLRHRRAVRSIHQHPHYSEVRVGQPSVSSSSASHPFTLPGSEHEWSSSSPAPALPPPPLSLEAHPHRRSVPLQVQRKPSLSSIRHHIPPNIKILSPSLKASSSFIDSSSSSRIISPSVGTAMNPKQVSTTTTNNNSYTTNDNSPPSKSRTSCDSSYSASVDAAAVATAPSFSSSNADDDDIFDWEEDKIDRLKQGSLSDDDDDDGNINNNSNNNNSSSNNNNNNSKARGDILQDEDLCCGTIQRHLHPRVVGIIANAVLILLYSIPVLVQHSMPKEHNHRHNANATIVAIKDGQPYMAVMLSLHLGYFLIQILVRSLFKLAYNCGSITIKLKLETHDALVPGVGRSVWLGVLALSWYLCVEKPTCLVARHGHETEIAESLVDLTCRRWFFWWVTRFLAGVQLTNILYLLKRYAMQSISDRFDQDEKRLREAHFQGYVLEQLEKIKRANKLHYYHQQQHQQQQQQHMNGNILYGNSNNLQASKYLSWSTSSPRSANLVVGGGGGGGGGCSGGKSPLVTPKSSSMSQPTSAAVDGDHAPTTAGILTADHYQHHLNHMGKARTSTWDYLKNSIQKRRRQRLARKRGGSIGGIGSIAGGGVPSHGASTKTGVIHAEININSSNSGSGHARGSKPGEENTMANKASGRKGSTSPTGSIHDTEKEHEDEVQGYMGKRKKTRMIDSLRNKPIENPYKKARELWESLCPSHRNYLERADLEGGRFSKKKLGRIWKLFDPNGGDTITRAMFKKGIVDIVNLRKSVTSAHKAFENAMAKLDMLFNLLWIFFAVIAFLVVYDVGVQQYAVSVSS